MNTKQLSLVIAIMLTGIVICACGSKQPQPTAPFSYAQGEYLFPSIGSTHSDEGLYITRALLAEEYTILDMQSYNGGQRETCSIDTSAYLAAGGERYRLVKAEGIAYAPGETFYPDYESGCNVCISFRLYFEPMPDTIATFDLVAGGAGDWNMEGVNLARGEFTPVTGRVITTDTHRWECKGVEVRDSVTILIKVVTPTIDGTYMQSTTAEFIEDAATGDKYYLTASSLGFAASPLITYEREPITFYEVYPALPSSVTAVGINSGSSYYASDVRIR